MKREINIVYLCRTTHIDDPEGSVTVGTCYEWRIGCREFEKHMDALAILQHPRLTAMSKGQGDYWENNHLTPWMDTLLRRADVHHSRQRMIDAGLIKSCKGRTDGWWLREGHDGEPVSLDEIIAHIKEKLDRG